MKFGDLELEPYAIGSPAVSGGSLAVGALSDDVRQRDAFDPANADFIRALERNNALAFGDLAMPRWVLLDCALLPSVVVGFADADRGPVSGFCAARTAAPDTVVAFSLFSLAPGLGARTKALGLLAYGARIQVGVTQYDNPVIRTHCAFGALEIVEPQVALHERADMTFVYRLVVPPDDALRALAFDGVRLGATSQVAAGSSAPTGTLDDPVELPIDADIGRRIADLGPGVRIEPPGRIIRDGVPTLRVTPPGDQASRASGVMHQTNRAEDVGI